MIKPSELPAYLQKNVIVRAKEDNPNAGWYAPNSVNVRDIVPTFTVPGGGISSSDITDLPRAIIKCKQYLRQRVIDAEMKSNKYIMFEKDLQKEWSTPEQKADKPSLSVETS